MQIIQAGPSSRSLRQQAFQEGINQVMQGAGQFADAYQNKQATERERALQKVEMAQQFANQGVNLTDDDMGAIDQAVSTGEIGAGFKSILNRASQARRQASRQADPYAQQIKELQVQKLQGEVAAQKTGKDTSLEVPGLGMARTESEAKEMRQTQADAEDAGKIIEQIKSLGTNIDISERGKIAKIDQLKTVLAGKLRLPLTGPGAMTEDEFQRLIGTIGDPSALFSTENVEMAKLDQLKDILGASVKSKFSSMGQQRPSQGMASQQYAPVNTGYQGGQFAPPQLPGMINQAQASPLQSVGDSDLLNRKKMLLQKAGK